MTGEFVWYDLFTEDVSSASQFYEQLFGWSFVPSLSGNSRVKRIFSGDTYIGNAIEIIPRKKNESESQWLSYVAVESVEDTVKLVKKNGGIIKISPREIPRKGRVAVCLDSQKAVFAIINPREPDNSLVSGGFNNWLGNELWTEDVEQAERFYGNIFGYDMQTIEMQGGETYQMFVRGGQLRAGIVKIPFADVAPNWVPYVVVEDTLATAKKVVRLGGQLLTEPDRDLPENAAVIVADPNGVVFGIQQVAPVVVEEGGVQ